MGREPVLDAGPEAGSVFGYSSQGFLFHGPNEVLVRTVRAGIYKTVNGGQHWVRSQRGLLNGRGMEPWIQGLCQARSAPQIAYAVTSQDGIARTEDFGETWGPLILPPDTNLAGCEVEPFNPEGVYVSTQGTGSYGTLFKSADGGRSFTRLGLQLISPSGVSVAPTGPKRIYVVEGFENGRLYVSSDGGLSFRSFQSPDYYPSKAYLHPAEESTLFLFAGFVQQWLFRSTDGGASFTRVGAGLPWTLNALEFDPNNPSVIYVAGGGDGLFRSIDGGLTFVRLTGLGEAELAGIGASAVGLTVEDVENPPLLYVSTGLGPSRSDDGGGTFSPIHTGFRGTTVTDLTIDAGGRLLVATDDSAGVFRSIGSGEYQNIGDTLPNEAAANVQAVAAAPDNPELYGVTVTLLNDFDQGIAIFRTANGGRSWSRAQLGASFILPFTRARMTFAPSDASRVYMVGNAGLFRSDDGGESFQHFGRGFSLASIAVDTHNPDVLYVGRSNLTAGILRSVDGGQTFEQLGGTGNVVYAIALDPKRPEVIYAGLYNSRVIRSLDGGVTFAPADVGLNGDRVLGLAVDPGQPMRLFAWMRAGGLFRSDNGADSWIALDTGESLRRSTVQYGLTGLAIDPSDPERIYMGNGSVLQFINP